MPVLGDAAVVGQGPDQAGALLVVGHHRARVAVGAQVLARVEAGRGDPPAAGGAAVPGRALALRGVLDDLDVRRQPGGEFRGGGALPVQVDRDHRAGGPADRLQCGLRVHQQGVGQAVDQHRPGADPGDGARGGDEGVGGQHHLVADADTARAQGQFEGVGAVGDAHAVPDPGEVGVLALERTDLRTADEGGVGEHAVETGP